MRNLAKCKRCGDIIESKSVHDFEMCSCGSIFVDGGEEYLRRGGDPEAFDEEYDKLHGIEVDKPDEDDTRGYKKVVTIDRKYGSPMLKTLVQMCDEDGMRNLYVKFVRCRRRAHCISLVSRVLWCLGLGVSIASLFYTSLAPNILALTFFVFGTYLECGAMFLICEAHHHENAIVIAAVNCQLSELTDEVERLENERKKKNAKRTRKTQRKSA